MATTTNYGWTTPDDTALVKDGAAAIRSLGSSIDSSLSKAVLQVVQATDNTVTNNSTTTYADTSLSASITPSKNTNKVLIIVTTVIEKTNGNSSNGVKYRLLRDSSTTVWELRYLLTTGTAISNIGTLSMAWLDSPATTSAITYKTQLANEVAAANVLDNSGAVTGSTITLLEVKA